MVFIRLPGSKNSQRYTHPTSGSLRYTSSFRLARRFIPLVFIAVVLFESYRFLYTFPTSLLPHEKAAKVQWDVEPVDDRQIDGEKGMGDLKNLVVVGCHAVWMGGETKGLEDAEWRFHGDYQKGDPPTYVKHIEEGVKAAAADPESLLLFSGGETIPSAGPRSEALSYYEVASSRSLLPPALRNRTSTEIFALDSYQNLLFSVCRFHELTSHYPSTITVVSHAFKQHRFEHLHRKALRYPLSQFRFIGVNAPRYYNDESIKEKIERGEELTVKEWSKDLYGCSQLGGNLRVKRVGRNWGRRIHPYTKTCPEMEELLEWCGGEETGGFPGSLPWEEK